MNCYVMFFTISIINLEWIFEHGDVVRLWTVVSNDHLSRMLPLTLEPIFIGGIENSLESRFGLFLV